MPPYLITLLILAVLAIFKPDVVGTVVDGLTTIDGVVCHLAPIVKTDVGSREGEDSSFPSCDSMTSPGDSGRSLDKK